MNNIELILLGKIIKTLGFQGELVIRIEKQFSKEIEKEELVFVMVEGIQVPFFINSINYVNSGTLHLQFQDYTSDSRVKEFVGCDVFIPGRSTPDITDNSIPGFLTGYRILNSDKQEIGTITKIVSYPMQVMLVVEPVTGEEILIPYNDDWIITTDDRKKLLILDLPEGIDLVNL